jgi:hypothetical protein
VKRLLSACIVVVCASCVAPAYNDSQFASKAAKTAMDASSAIETARLALQVDLRHGLPEQPVDPVVSRQEDALGSVAGTFASVEPPQTKASDDLRTQVLDLLNAAQSHMADARIALRRGDVQGALRAIDEAEPQAKKLQAIADKY